MSVVIDQPVADFEAQATSGQTFSLAGLKGKQVVIYFYPKDSTPGCTTEGQGFRDQHAAFKAANTEALARGVFGTPFMFVDGEPFWGQDRMTQIERWLQSGPF